MTNYLIKEHTSLTGQECRYQNFFNQGVLKIESDISEQDNINLAELINAKGSKVFKTPESLASNFGDLTPIIDWIEKQVSLILHTYFNVEQKIFDRQFKANSFLQIAPVSPKSSNVDHQSDLHIDTFSLH